MTKRFKYELVQDGIVVAGIDATTFDEAKREIMRYAMLYAQDGPCSIRGTDVERLADAIGAEKIS